MITENDKFLINKLYSFASVVDFQKIQVLTVEDMVKFVKNYNKLYPMTEIKYNFYYNFLTNLDENNENNKNNESDRYFIDLVFICFCKINDLNIDDVLKNITDKKLNSSTVDRKTIVDGIFNKLKNNKTLKTNKDHKDAENLIDKIKSKNTIINTENDESKALKTPKGNNYEDFMNDVLDDFKKDCKKGVEIKKYNSIDEMRADYEKEESSYNNGGKTDYYKLDKKWEMVQDIIEDRNMNFSQGNILKAAFCFNTNRHQGTNYERELNKIIYFAERELERLKRN